MIRILVLNRMHLDEWPAEPVEAILDNLRGHPGITAFTRQAPGPGEASRRGYDDNITECFPGSRGGNREQRDAWTITQLARKTDLVLDIHGTRDSDETFPFYGPPGHSSALVGGVASLLGSDHAVVMGAPHPAGVLRNYIGWDLAPGSPLLRELPGWLAALAAGWIPPQRPMREYRSIGGMRESDAARLGLRRSYPPFSQLPGPATRALGISTPAYAFSWNADRNCHTGYRGEIAIPYPDHFPPAAGQWLKSPLPRIRSRARSPTSISTQAHPEPRAMTRPEPGGCPVAVAGSVTCPAPSAQAQQCRQVARRYIR